MGKSIDNISIEDLAPVDEFHIGGRAATDNLIEQLNFSDGSNILDVGCGLGGAARYVSKKFKTSVSGVDLSAEYIETGNALSTWLNLDSQVNLSQGSALSMPYQDNEFDGGFMLHVGMNIKDKSLLFKEVHRVLKSGSLFGIDDIMRDKAGNLTYPVPWASKDTTSKLSTIEQYKEALINSGFEIAKENNRRAFAIEFFKQAQINKEKHISAPSMGLHILMKETTKEKIQNMIKNIVDGYIFPVEIIVKKHN